MIKQHLAQGPGRVRIQGKRTDYRSLLRCQRNKKQIRRTWAPVNAYDFANATEAICRLGFRELRKALLKKRLSGTHPAPIATAACKLGSEISTGKIAGSA